MNPKTRLHASAILLALAVACPAADGYATPEEISRAPTVDELTLATPAGHYLRQGRPIFLLGTQFVERYYAGFTKGRVGYDREHAWLYEEPMGFTNLRRLGLQTLGYFADDSWQDAIIPGMSHPFDLEDAFRRMIGDTRVPVYVDTSCFPWSHALLAAKGPAKGLPAIALNQGSAQNNHWMPYSATTAEGRRLWFAMWEHAAREMKQRGYTPLVFELLNEPAYDDTSEVNRASFAARLAKKYGTISALNAAWGQNYKDFAAVAAFKQTTTNPALQAEWCMFMSDAVIDLVREGRDRVRAIAPGTPCAVQPLGNDRYRAVGQSNVDLEQAAAIMDVVGSGTGAGMIIGAGSAKPSATVMQVPDTDSRSSEGFIHHRLLRAVAGSKPIYDGESYAATRLEPHTSGQLSSRLWLEIARGMNASYIFSSQRRTWDELVWKDGDEAGGRRTAEKFPYDMLNPYAVSPQALRGIMQFNRDRDLVEQVIVPRQNRTRAQVAILVSTATERLAPAVEESLAYAQQLRCYASALEFSHIPWDVITDRQCKNASAYQAIIVPHVPFAEAETVEQLAAYAKGGGTLILATDHPTRNQLARPLPETLALGPALGRTLTTQPAALTLTGNRSAAMTGTPQATQWRAYGDTHGWDVIGRLGGEQGTPVILQRASGKGRIVHINLRTQTYPVAAILGSLLAPLNLPRTCDVRSGDDSMAVNIEAHRFTSGSVTVTVLINHDSYAKVLTIDAPAAIADLHRRKLLPTAAGRASLAIESRGATVVVQGEAAALAELNVGAGGAVTVAELQAEVESLNRSDADRTDSRLAKPYDDRRELRMLDLRRQANRGFLDQVQGDGVGGWTDQGATASLVGTPWGRADLLGVPFEFIRADENFERTCLVTKSAEVPAGASAFTGIPVGSAVDGIYFLHTSAWAHKLADGTTIATYRITYADGGTVMVPIRSRTEVGNWWDCHEPATLGSAKRAWANGEDRCLWTWFWQNPEPARIVASFDLLAGDTSGSLILVGATAAQARPPSAALPVTWSLKPFDHSSGSYVEGVMTMGPLGQPRPWRGVTLSGAPIAPPAGRWGERVVLSCEVNGGKDQWGAHRGGQRIQVSLLVIGSDGKEVANGERKAYVELSVPGGIDDDPASWQKAEATLAPFPADAGISALRVQFNGPADAEVSLRAIEFH